MCSSDLHRAKLDSNHELLNFSKTLEATCISTVESGQMTKDLALLVHGKDMCDKDYLTTELFLAKLKENLDGALAE